MIMPALVHEDFTACRYHCAARWPAKHHQNITGTVRRVCRKVKRRRDLSGLVKAPEDLLVAHGIIEADDTRIVRSFSTHISDLVKGVKIEIESV